VSPQSPPSSSPGPRIEVKDRLDLDKYDAPRSHHASRAFAEMTEARLAQARLAAAQPEKKASRTKLWLVVALVVLGTAATSVLLARHFAG
jgi:hypothetical protein